MNTSNSSASSTSSAIKSSNISSTNSIYKFTERQREGGE
jgi:hypothetical protein